MNPTRSKKAANVIICTLTSTVSSKGCYIPTNRADKIAIEQSYISFIAKSHIKHKHDSGEQMKTVDKKEQIKEDFGPYGTNKYARSLKAGQT